MQFNLEKTQADVPVSLRHGSRELPLGRYLRGKLRQIVDKEKPVGQNEKQKAEMQELLTASRLSTSHPSLKSQSVLRSQQAALTQQARAKIYSKRKKL